MAALPQSSPRDRTWTLRGQGPACCRLHQGAAASRSSSVRPIWMGGFEPPAPRVRGACAVRAALHPGISMTGSRGVEPRPAGFGDPSVSHRTLPRAPRGSRTPVASLEDWSLSHSAIGAELRGTLKGFLATSSLGRGERGLTVSSQPAGSQASIASRGALERESGYRSPFPVHRSLLSRSPPEIRTRLCGLRARCITRQCLQGENARALTVHRSLFTVHRTLGPPGRTRTSIRPRIRRVLDRSATGGAGETRTHKAFVARRFSGPRPHPAGSAPDQVGRVRTASSGFTVPRSAQ
jgi:hypothetical protein